MNKDENFMKIAISKAKEGIELGQTPFGAIIVKDNSIIAEAHNTVWKDLDPTAHAEVNAIRIASRKLGSIDLSGCVIYSTCEPCPMCLSAIHWSKIDRLVYGAEISDAVKAGFSELLVPAIELAKQGGSTLKIDNSCMAEQCRELFSIWKNKNLSGVY